LRLIGREHFALRWRQASRRLFVDLAAFDHRRTQFDITANGDA
jgi:hypothetical protein